MQATIIMKRLATTMLLAAVAAISPAVAQDDVPKVSAIMTYVDEKNETQETTSITDCDAPLEVTFSAIAQNMGSHTPAYEWHFRKEGQATDMLVRYEETTTYRFVESGTFNITLLTTLTDTGEELDSATVTVTISESQLEYPNAFSPNDDSRNDRFVPKKCRSIVQFHAYIFNRWGQKLIDWTDPNFEWDGTAHGKPLKDGVYFLLVKAKGADGRDYNIRKDVNLLRGYTETNNSTTSTP